MPPEQPPWPAFEGFGDDRGIGARRTRLECKICWYVYDPAEGDAVWQIPPGTPFTAAAPALDLPELLGARQASSWCCPMTERARRSAADGRLPGPSRARAAFGTSPQHADARAADFVNPALAVEAVGFRPWEDHWLGVMVTPWFMNLG